MVKIFPLLVCLILLRDTTTIFTSGCEHDHRDHESLEILVVSEEFRGERRLDGYSNIRIYVDYTNLQSIEQKWQDFVSLMLMPAVVDYFQAALQVVPLSYPIVKSGTCGSIAVPSSYSEGLNNYDLVLLLNASRNTSATWIAYGSSCLLDGNTNRPIFGSLLLNTAAMSLDSNNWNSQLYAVLHQIIHILAFSTSLYEYWIDPSTGQQLSGHVGTLTINGFDSFVLLTSNVVQQARNQFNCASIFYVRLENQGGNYSTANHWERRLFGNELMTSTQWNDPRLSAITLALLEDSGWYQVDYSKAEPLQFGQNKTCKFVNNNCLSGSPAIALSTEFCATPLASSCNFDYSARGVCAISSYPADFPSSAWSYWNYFGNQTVAYDNYSDNCPIIYPYSNYYCNDPTTIPYGYVQSEYFGSDSACFDNTLVLQSITPTLGLPMGSCLKYQCQLVNASYVLQVFIGNITVVCGAAGNQAVTGYNGNFTCPDPKFFCGVLKAPYCPLGCSGHGTCNNGTCTCNAGFQAPGCSQRITIPNSAACACVFPRVNSYGSTCLCPGIDCSVQPLFPTVTQCAACQPNCIGCTNVTSCNTCADNYWSNQGVCQKCASPACELCSDAIGCDECFSGYLLANNTCTPICSASCLSCTLPYTCSSCNVGYYVSNQQCYQCSTGCQVCTGASACQYCLNGYYLLSGMCYSCITGCILCNSNSTCLACNQPLYYLQNSICYPTCSANCQQCTAPNTCDICNTGYYIQGSQCLQCPSSCVACQNSSFCTNCQQYYYLNSSTNLCTACSDGCALCNSSLTCTECNTGYSRLNGNCYPDSTVCPSWQFYDSVNESCYSCSDGCLSCKNATYCVSCSQSYYSSNFSCYPCGNYCDTCFNQAVCVGCQSQYTLIQGMCEIVCPTNCEACLNSINCTQCSTNSAMTPSGTCTSCPTGCTSCSIGSGGNLTCTSCAGNLILNSQSECVSPTSGKNNSNTSNSSVATSSSNQESVTLSGSTSSDKTILVASLSTGMLLLLLSGIAFGWKLYQRRKLRRNSVTAVVPKPEEKIEPASQVPPYTERSRSSAVSENGQFIINTKCRKLSRTAFVPTEGIMPSLHIAESLADITNFQLDLIATQSNVANGLQTSVNMASDISLQGRYKISRRRGTINRSDISIEQIDGAETGNRIIDMSFKENIVPTGKKETIVPVENKDTIAFKETIML